MNLTDSEIDQICSGYVQNAAKIRFLRTLGLTVHRKPNGKPLVNSNHYNSVMSTTNNQSNTNQKSDHDPVWGVH